MRVPVNARLALAGAAALVVVAVAAVPVAAKTKIKTDYDKTARFDGIKTWSWLEDPKVIHAGANPDVVKDARLEQGALSPPTKASVERAMAAKGYRLVAAGAAAPAQVAVYLIGRAGTSSQDLGQFIPYTVSWAYMVGGYTPTQALRIYETGTLILDIIDPAKKSAVWRGTATGEIDRENSQEKRLAIIDTLVQNMLKKFPPK
jgi:hypothetical protein